MAEPHLRALRCVCCERVIPPSSGLMTCPVCGPSGTLDVLFDWDSVRFQLKSDDLDGDPRWSIERYAPLLPVAFAEEPLPLPVGGTPLVRASRLGSQLGVAQLWVKDESRQPSASLKDRASVVAALHARQEGASKMATASTGNAASSLATIGAALGMPSVIFVPAGAPRAKLAQLQMCGAELFLVEGSYDDAFRLCAEACAHFGWYNRSTGINPFCGEGKKTCALEIWEQLGRRVPDRLFVSVGDGCILGGLYKGFRDLIELGWSERLPRLYGVQAEGSCVIARGYAEGRKLTPAAPTTYADSIAVKNPADFRKAWRAVEKSGGAFVMVSDDEIWAAARTLARLTGIFGEPSGAASLAGLIKVNQQEPIPQEERVILAMTGSGLKDVEGALRACGHLPEPLPPTLDALAERL